MKRLGNMMPQVAEWGNLAEAFHKAASGKRYHAAVIRYEENLETHLNALSASLLTDDIQVGRFHRFVVCDPKVRVIHAACFEERVLHHALMNIAGPSFEKGAIDSSFACRKGKGNRAAVDQALRHTGGARYFLKLDVRRFFDSIPHERLSRRFRRLFKDASFLKWLNAILYSFETTEGRGLPIGTLTSQYFANFYLDPMDRWIKEDLKCRRYVRFMDDFVLWHDDKGQLEDWKTAIEEWLNDYLALKLKEKQILRSCREGLPFLGYRIKPGRVLLDRRSRRRFRKRLAHYAHGLNQGTLEVSDFQRGVSALLSFTAPTQCQAWRRNLLRNEFPELLEA